MRLLLMRHAEAVPGRDDDPLRPLTEAGCNALSHPGQAVLVALSEVSELLASPWLRAQQTAALMRSRTAAQTVQHTDLLLPSADPEAVLERLESVEADVLLLVAHQPLVGKLAALLCDGFHALPWAFSPADMAVIDLDWPAAGLGYLRGWHHFPN